MPALLLLVAAAASMPLPDWARSYATDTLHLKNYRAASVDLNGDGRPEVLVYSEDWRRCGTSDGNGCTLWVLTRRGRTTVMIGRMTIAFPPIWLLHSRSHGWRDLAMQTARGGSLPNWVGRMQFDGRRYPANPSFASEPSERSICGVLIDSTPPLRPVKPPYTPCMSGSR